MKRTTRIAAGAVLVAAIASPVLAFPFYGRIVPVLGPILPRHEGVPSNASANYSLKEGVYWTWQRPLKAGCAKWMAMDSFASVVLAHGQEGCTKAGKTLAYHSFAEEVVFYEGGGDLPSGTWLGGEPCPYKVPASDIRAFAELAVEARKTAQTEAEKGILLQMLGRLARVNGDALTTDHTGGCNDLKIADYSGPARPHLDVWNARS